MAQSQELRAQMVRLRLIFTYIWLEDVANPSSARSPEQLRG